MEKKKSIYYDWPIDTARCSRFALVSCLEETGHLCTAIIQFLDHVSGKALQIHGTEDLRRKSHMMLGVKSTHLSCLFHLLQVTPLALRIDIY